MELSILKMGKLLLNQKFNQIKVGIYRLVVKKSHPWFIASTTPVEQILWKDKQLFIQTAGHRGSIKPQILIQSKISPILMQVNGISYDTFYKQEDDLISLRLQPSLQPSKVVVSFTSKNTNLSAVSYEK